MVEVDIRGQTTEIKEIVNYLKQQGFQETFRWAPAHMGFTRIILTRPTLGSSRSEPQPDSEAKT